MKVFFHADDAGAGRQATKKIVDCWEKGYVDGYSIIADENCYDIITDSLQKLPEKYARLSVHLNITDGYCLNQQSAGTLIASPNGRLKLTFIDALLLTFKNSKTKRQFEEQVFMEWDSQINSIKKNIGKREIDTLDSHNHVHMIPALFDVILRLSVKHQIKNIRFAKEIFSLNDFTDGFNFFFWKNTLKWIVINYLCWRIKNKKYKFSPKAQFITGILYSGHMSAINIKGALSKAERKGASSVEVVYHPGRALPDEMENWALSTNARSFFTSEWRDREYETAKKIKHECGHYFENY